MRKPEERKSNKHKIKKKVIAKPKKEQVLVVAQEIKFARLLSGNEKKVRDRVLKAFKKWLRNCFEKGYEFKEQDFTRVWKGLFYAVWMSDKPLIQEELCDSIAGILQLFPEEQLDAAMLMFHAGLKVLASEWYGIDQHRMDKFLMLVRRCVRGALVSVRGARWVPPACEVFVSALADPDGILSPKTPFYARNATSMILHVLDCYLEEIAKISEGDIPEASVAALMRPVCTLMCEGEATLAIGARRVLAALLRQSELGLQTRHAEHAWRAMGCPAPGPQAMQLVQSSDSDDDNDSDGASASDGPKPLDPRAGRVDVELHSVPVPCQLMVDMLKTMISTTSSKAHRRAKIYMQRFEQLSRQQYPLQLHYPSPPRGGPPRPARAAMHLKALDLKYTIDSDELALRGLSRKHRKRLLARSRAGESLYDLLNTAAASDTTPPTTATTTANTTTGQWTIEETAPNSTDKGNKENVSKKKKRKLKKEKESPSKKQKTGEEVSIGKEDTEVKNKYEKQNENKKQVKKEKMNGVKPNAGLQLIFKEKAKEKKEIKTDKLEIIFAKKPSGGDKERIKVDKNLSLPLTPKKVKFVLKNNSMQGTVDYYKSVRKSPSIPFDSSKRPVKTNLKVSAPSPINPFAKNKLRFSRKSC